MSARWPLLLLALAAHAASADTFRGTVISISDGDTLTVLVDRRQIKIRLTEIDAPELKQAFGTRARQSLGELCSHQTATVHSSGKDRYGRVLGRVECGGIDVSAEQVHRGMAWVYDRYVTDRSLYALQSDARTGRLGLWVDAAPMAPWTWRANKKH